MSGGAPAAARAPAVPKGDGGTDYLDIVFSVLTDWRVLAALGFTLVIWFVFRTVGVLYRRQPRSRKAALGRKKAAASPAPGAAEVIED